MLEFGSRRAQGADGAILGARAAYIGGCDGTACTISDQLYGVLAGGTMAHSWVQMFDSEYEAFKTLLRAVPDERRSARRHLQHAQERCAERHPRVQRGAAAHWASRKCGIRLDSGDMTYLTKKARKMLDEAGWPECEISVSNSLDEYLIQDLLRQGAQIDMFGVGERLITATQRAGVRWCVQARCRRATRTGRSMPKIKISENVGKITNPHFKKLYRFYGADTGKAIADYLCLHDETVNDGEDLEIFDPEATWKRKKVY